VPGFVDGHSPFFTCGEVQVQALCASPPAGTCPQNPKTPYDAD